MSLPHFSLEAKPYTYEFRRRTTINVHMIDEPFTIDTQEGILKISPETCDDFADGYCVVYPSDGSKPYAMSRKYLADNYERIPYAEGALSDQPMPRRTAQSVNH